MIWTTENDVYCLITIFISMIIVFFLHSMIHFSFLFLVAISLAQLIPFIFIALKVGLVIFKREKQLDLPLEK